MSAKVDTTDPQVKRLVYNMYRNILGNYNEKANLIVNAMPKERVTQDQGISKQLESMIRQSSQISQGGGGNSPGGPVSPPGGNGNSAPLPPPPPPMAPSGGIPPVRIQSEIGPKKFSEPPAAIQNAMMTKDKKPFTYTPGGLDLTEIRSPRMARRINRNAHVQDSCSGPPPPKTSPLVQQPPGPLPPAVIAAMQPQLPIQVFPSGVPPPPPIPDSSGKTSVRAPPPPPMPDQSIRPSEGVLPPPFIEDNGSKTSVGAPPPPPMPDQSNKAPCHTLRPDLVSELQRQPSLRPVGPPQSRPDFVAEIPNHAPLRPVNFGARFSQPQEPAQIPQPPLKNVQSQPKPPQEASTVKTQEPDLSQEEFPKYQLPKLAETAPVQVRPAIHTTPNNANVSMPPTPPTPPTGNLNKSPAPWMNSGQKQMSKEVPAWATLNRAPSREESAVKESQPSFTATQQTPQSSFSTSQQTPQTSFTAPQQPSQTRIIPIQIEGREPPKQQVASPQNNHQPIKLEGQSQSQGRTRIIPIQMEGAGESTSPRQPVHRQASLPAGVRGPPNFSPNKFNQTPSPYPNSQMPMDTNDGRGRQQLQSQQSWSQPNNGTPIQSRSFRVLQKMTGSDEQAQGSLLPGQAFLMNRVYPRQEEIPTHQYLGGDMSGRPPQNMSSGQDNTGRPGESEY